MHELVQRGGRALRPKSRYPQAPEYEEYQDWAEFEVLGFIQSNVTSNQSNGPQLLNLKAREPESVAPEEAEEQPGPRGHEHNERDRAAERRERPEVKSHVLPILATHRIQSSLGIYEYT